MQVKYSKKQKALEIFAVALTGICKFIFVDLWPHKGLYVSIACVLWITYILWQYRRDKTRLMQWGFTRESFKRSFLELLPIAAGFILLFLIAGLIRKTIILNWHMILVLVLYPVWGIIQQFLMMALFAGNLYDLKDKKWPKAVILIVTSGVFSIVHFPSLFLIAGTFLLALIYTNHYLYRKQKNLWVLGLYHGWLACFFYYMVLCRDPWEEFMRIFL